MKLRTGFVSNSSSSSFVIILEEDKFQEFSKHTLHGSNEMFDAFSERKTLFGRKFRLLQFRLGNCNSFEFYDKSDFPELAKNISSDGHAIIDDFNNKCDTIEKYSEYIMTELNEFVKGIPDDMKIVNKIDR